MSFPLIQYFTARADSHHECPGDVAAESPGSQQETLSVHHLVQVQGGNQPPAHQLQVQVHGRLCKPARIEWSHNLIGRGAM